MVSSIQFLIYFIVFILVFSFVSQLINEHSIGTDDYIPVAQFPTLEHTGFWDTLGAVWTYMLDSAGYYFALFTSNDFSTFVTMFIITPALLIALFIFIKEILIPFIQALPFT